MTHGGCRLVLLNFETIVYFSKMKKINSKNKIQARRRKPAKKFLPDLTSAPL
jgi:hypothetical protein